ncbi:MAG: VWA domain-containing protein [Armatimonadetes bacterium]|nr:VWA domain-containing protein [Armatimonadota bacterium]
MLEWIPDRPALCRDQACSTDVLVRIVPVRETRADEPRPEVNLTLVIDRSGSMEGKPIELTRDAASLAVRALQARDSLSIVLFDNEIEVLWPSSPIEQREPLLAAISSSIYARGGTALFDGWSHGAREGVSSLHARRLNRVILLTDGEANIGETSIDRICDQVHQKARQGLQTTTMGLGTGYNEELLRSMAASGGGNHFFVETPEQLTRYFELELEALAFTVGTQVTLRLVPLVEGVVIEPLGEVQRTEDGAYALADMMADCPLEQFFRITCPASASEEPPVTAELSWHSPRSGQEFQWKVPLVLPRVTGAERLALTIHPDVVRRQAMLMAGQARQEATAAMKAGDRAQATQILSRALEHADLPAADRTALQQLKQTVERGDQSASSKMAASMSYYASRGSVALTGIDVTLVQTAASGLNAPIRYGRFLQEGPPATVRYLHRAQAMLAGLFEGEALGRPQGSPRGEASVLTMVTLPHITGRNSMLKDLQIARAWAEAPVEEPSGSLLQLEEKDAMKNLCHGGRSDPDNAALRRIAPLVLARWGSRCQGPAAPSFVFLGAHITHNDAASAASCLGFAALLWDLLAAERPPAPEFYLDRFLEVIADLETDKTYAARTPRYDGWEGRLSEFLTLVIPDARRRGLSAGRAHREWGSSSYLLETVPTVLYILERYGTRPAKALRKATQGSADPGSLGALVGAALGALHGVQPGWRLDPDQEEALADLGKRLS